MDLLLGPDVDTLGGFVQDKLGRAPPDIALIGCRSLGVRTANRLIKSVATVRSRALSMNTPSRDSSRRWAAEMLNAMDWKLNMPSTLRLAGSSAMPCRCASWGERGATLRPLRRISPLVGRSIP